MRIRRSAIGRTLEPARRREHAARLVGQHFVRELAPLDRLDVAALDSDASTTSLDAPRAVSETLRLESAPGCPSSTPRSTSEIRRQKAPCHLEYALTSWSFREPADDRVTHAPRRPGRARAAGSGPRPRSRRRAMDPRAEGSRRGRCGRSGASQQPAAIPRPDSSMQPSMTPMRSARAACAMRIPSRMPPDFASLMLMPCATSAQVATSASVWQSSST